MPVPRLPLPLLLVALAGCESAPPKPAALPELSSNLALHAPVERWDEGIPLGNGRSGGMLWGGDRRIVLSLDHNDLWDLRTPETYQRDDWTYATMRALVAAQDQGKMVELFDRPYSAVPYPTKIPAGRLELELTSTQRVQELTLDLGRAQATATVTAGRIEMFFAAAGEDVAMLRYPVAMAPGVRLAGAPALQKLGYGAPSGGHDEDSVWFVQQMTGGGAYAVLAGWRVRAGTREVAVAISLAIDGDLALRDARERVGRALDTGYDALLLQHRSWWIDFWGSSNVTVPDRGVQAQYELVKYLYGAGSRRGAPPMPLQGVWSGDDDALPPWKGDYHNDFNTEMTYLAYHTAGLVDAGESYLQWNWLLLPRYREFARRFYGVTGAVVPGTMALDGQPLGGWAQYALSPTNGAWVAHAFYLHWRYTADATFLAERAYPFCAEIGEALLALLESKEGGPPVLPLSTSPELFDNTMRAWLPPDSSYDQALLRWLFGALAEMAGELKDAPAAERWAAAHDRLAELDVGADGSLMIAPGVSYDVTHRHFSHMLAFYPLSLLTVDDPAQKKVIDASLDRILEKGPGAWMGYSFPWMACLLARAGRGREALEQLRSYEHAFLSRNGFHLNGDQTSDPITSYRTRAFTVEGNFLAMQAVQEMLVQSHGGLIRVFPAVPDEWGNAAFELLSVEGGHRVSATRLGGRTTSVRIIAGRSGLIRLRNPFEGGTIFWNADVHKSGDVYEVQVLKGQQVFGRVLMF